MDKLKKKLYSQGGVTILLALLGFMVAAMVSVVIVTAAISAAKRVENDRAVTQNHLTLESAAQLVRDQMTGEVSAAAKTTVTKTTTLKDGVSYTAYTSNGTFGQEMLTAVQSIDRGTSYESSDKALEITVSGADPEFDTVYVSYVMQTAAAAGGGGDYHLIFTFSLDQSSEALYLTMNGKSTVDSKTPNVTEISWNAVSINGLGGSSE